MLCLSALTDLVIIDVLERKNDSDETKDQLIFSIRSRDIRSSRTQEKNRNLQFPDQSFS